MQALLAQGYEGQIDLIYIDPPFNTGEDFNFNNEVKIGNSTYEKELPLNERLSYSDTWSRGYDSFLDMIYPRLQLMQRLLSEDGSIYVHCDWRINSHIRLIMEEIFNRENLRNEIIWVRSTNPKGSQYVSSKFDVYTETIYYFAKSGNTKINLDDVRIPLTESELREKYWKSDEKGRFYDGPIVRSISMGNRPTLVYEYKGYTPPPCGWRVNQESLIEIDKSGNLGWTSNGNPYRKLRSEDDRAHIPQYFPQE